MGIPFRPEPITAFYAGDQRVRQALAAAGHLLLTRAMIGAALDLAKPSHLASQLSLWFLKNRRPLPWRADRDPYRIWVSEVMLQQTTVVAVIPYYENFLRKFPTLRHLAKAPLEQVLEAWSGLGYYSRARRLKEAAVALNQMGGFPQTSAQLAKLPGFGPYTSRAVSSLAFGEKVGVVDGNVIRVLTRLMGFQGEWWSAAAARHLQALADKLSEKSDPYVYNQAVMELGATVCTPQNPSCSVCPVAARCVARTQNLTPQIPAPRPRPEKQIWIWQPSVILKKGKLAVKVNDYAPFLRGQLLLPGRAQRVETAPTSYTYKHYITRFEIFVQLKKAAPSALSSLQWIDLDRVSQHIPSTLIKKALDHYKVIEAAR